MVGYHFAKHVRTRRYLVELRTVSVVTVFYLLVPSLLLVTTVVPHCLFAQSDPLTRDYFKFGTPIGEVSSLFACKSLKKYLNALNLLSIHPFGGKIIKRKI